jgi:antitoxin HicB
MRQPAADAREQRPDDAYPIVLARAVNGDGPSWIATVEELPGCEAHGATPESAAAAMADAVEQWLREARADGREVPPPGAAAAHSGKLLVRMPRTLHADLAAAADQEGVSLNAFIVGALGGAVGWRSDAPDDAPARRAPVRAVGAEQPAPAGEAAPPRSATASRTLSVALVINLVVVVLAAAAAVALVIAAWPA